MLKNTNNCTNNDGSIGHSFQVNGPDQQASILMPPSKGNFGGRATSGTLPNVIARPSLVVVGRATCPSRSGLRQPSYSCPTPSCTVADILDLAEWPAEQLQLVVERWQPVAEVRIERIR